MITPCGESPAVSSLIWLSTTQSIASLVSTPLTFNTAVLDTAAMWAAGTPTRLTCSKAGVYIVGGSARFDGPVAPTGFRTLSVLLNGSISLAHIGVTAVTVTTVPTAVAASGTYTLVAGDILTVEVQHSQGTALDIISRNYSSPALWAVRVG